MNMTRKNFLDYFTSLFIIEISISHSLCNNVMNKNKKNGEAIAAIALSVVV